MENRTTIDTSIRRLFVLFWISVLYGIGFGRSDILYAPKDELVWFQYSIHIHLAYVKIMKKKKNNRVDGK